MLFRVRCQMDLEVHVLLHELLKELGGGGEFKPRDELVTLADLRIGEKRAKVCRERLPTALSARSVILAARAEQSSLTWQIWQAAIACTQLRVELVELAKAPPQRVRVVSVTTRGGRHSSFCACVCACAQKACRRE